ncbi:KAP NTPase domain-containing protein [Fusobacterium sp. oral taxon C10]
MDFLKKIFNFLTNYVIFPLSLSFIIYIFVTIEKYFFTKIIILILGLLIFINYYFYKKIVMIIRKTYVNRINYYLSIILIFLTFFNIENFKEVIKIINQNIKNNFNQKIFLEIKNFLNTTSYFYSFSIIFIMGIIFLSIIIYKKNNNKVEENYEEVKLLSFRKKEKEKLKSMIENKKISSILIEAEIGNGKTTLINSLFKDSQTEEIIYLKLPLVKSVDELKRNLFLELQKIFLKNDLDNQFLNAFLDNISAFKLGFIEINFGKRENMWNTIQKLQKTLKEANRNIIIILDDIERENDANKIYESILFLGELSEYFKDTKTITLLLTQYSYLEKKLKEIKIDTSHLEKYYKYKFKLNEPTASEFPDEDYKLLIEEAISTLPNLSSIDENFKDDFINSIIENINFFFTANEIIFNKENFNYIKINIRALEKSIKKIVYLYTFYKESYITYSIFLYCILMENFYIFLENYILEMSKEGNTSVKNIKKYILRAFSNFSLKYYSENNAYNICHDEIETILKTYNTGEIIIENIDIQSNIIKEILSGNIEKSGTFSVNGYEEYIFNLINGNPQKLDIALKNNFIKNKSELIKIVNRTKEILDLSKCSFNLMKNILLKGEYSQSELPTIPKDVEEIINCEKKENLRTEVFYKLDKSKETFINKIKEIRYFQNDLPEIESLLEKDIDWEKYYYDQATQ